MTQRDWVKIGGGVVIGMALAAVLGMSVFGVDFRRATDTAVTLYVPGTGGGCTVAKQQYVVTDKGKPVNWAITNYCEGDDRTVVVGNFRKSSDPSGASNCDSAGADYPFTNATLQKRTATVAFEDTEDIKLTVKGRGELGDEAVRVYFDICLDGEIVDPELMIRR